MPRVGRVARVDGDSLSFEPEESRVQFVHRKRVALLSCNPLALSEKCHLVVDYKVVARDGIEPPTPAFSGPRSTTELSGLGINAAYRGSPRTAVRYHLHLSPLPFQEGPTADGISNANAF
jgi:hypothetical protein